MSRQPLPALHPRQDPTRRCLRLADWPAADREAWLVAQKEVGFLKPGGVAARWSATTRHNAERGYGRLLTWLFHAGRLDPTAGIHQRYRPEVIKAFLQELTALNRPQSVLTRANELEMFGRAVLPSYDLSWLRRLQGELRVRVQYGHGKPGRLRHTNELIELGRKLMAEAESAQFGSTPRRRAIHFRDGLALAVLAHRPLRRRNFASLELGQHLQHLEDGWWLLIPADQVKNRRPIEVPFPASLAAALHHYLQVHRPVLAKADGRWQAEVGQRLWLSGDGSPMTEMALYDRVTMHTKVAFGQPLSLHLFRDCAATTVALEDPEHVRIGAQILGHETFATTERHYRLSRSIEAARRYHAALAALEEE